MREELNIKRYFSIHFEYWFKEIKSKPPISLVSNQYLMSFFFFFFSEEVKCFTANMPTSISFNNWFLKTGPKLFKSTWKFKN